MIFKTSDWRVNLSDKIYFLMISMEFPDSTIHSEFKDNALINVFKVGIKIFTSQYLN